MTLKRTITVVLTLMLSISLHSAASAEDRMIERLQGVAAFIKVEGIGKNNKPAAWTGSGVCIAPGGWMITNAHVVPGDARTAREIRTYCNSGYPGEFSGPAETFSVHADRDLALVKARLESEVQVLPLGDTSKVALTDRVRIVGFPYGSRVATKDNNPSVTITVGHISALRKNDDGRLWWIDVAAPVAGGNSGSAVVDANGRLIGVVTQRYEGFARAIPVEFVKELIGEAALDVSFEPMVASKDEGAVGVVVRPRGPARKFVVGQARLATNPGSVVRLTAKKDGTLEGLIKVKPDKDKTKQDRTPVVIRATTAEGYVFERVVGFSRISDPKVPLRATLYSLLLKPKKANGWWWDGNDPDPYCKIYVNGLLVKVTKVSSNQLRFLEATKFDCTAGDSIRVVVYDKDLVYDDKAGEIRFTAKGGLNVTKPTEGQIETCDIAIREIPMRLDVKK